MCKHSCAIVRSSLKGSIWLFVKNVSNYLSLKWYKHGNWSSNQSYITKYCPFRCRSCLYSLWSLNPRSLLLTSLRSWKKHLIIREVSWNLYFSWRWKPSRHCFNLCNPWLSLPGTRYALRSSRFFLRGLISIHWFIRRRKYLDRFMLFSNSCNILPSWWASYRLRLSRKISCYTNQSTAKAQT